MQKEIKKGTLETITPFYDKIKEKYKENEIAYEIKRMINENGSGGWNALHFGIYLGHNNVVKDLLDRLKRAFVQVCSNIGVYY